MANQQLSSNGCMECCVEDGVSETDLHTAESLSLVKSLLKRDHYREDYLTTLSKIASFTHPKSLSIPFPFAFLALLIIQVHTWINTHVSKHIWICTHLPKYLLAILGLLECWHVGRTNSNFVIFRV